MTTRLSATNRLLTGVFGFLLAVQLFYAVIGVASIPAYHRRVTAEAVVPVLYYESVQVSQELVTSWAAERGLSLAQYAVYRSTLNLLSAIIPLALSALILSKARRQWFAWYTAFIITFLGASSLGDQTLIAQLIPVELYALNTLFWFVILPYIYLFPNARAVPPRAAWLVGALVVYHFIVQTGTVVAYVAPDLAVQLRLPYWGNRLAPLPVLLNFVVVLGSQVYRYRKISMPGEQQQTKWFLFGFGLILALIPLSISLSVPQRQGFVGDIVNTFLWVPLYCGLALAVLRYRLWDVDVLIRKTLLYALVSGVLVLFYFGSVILLQSLVGQSAAAQSPLIIVVSTLLIAALFAPLRQRVQTFIDRRFYRRKYNAEQMLAGFAQTTRAQVELDELTAALLRVVEDTMRPETASVWLRPELQSSKLADGGSGR